MEISMNMQTIELKEIMENPQLNDRFVIELQERYFLVVLTYFVEDGYNLAVADSFASLESAKKAIRTLKEPFKVELNVEMHKAIFPGQVALAAHRPGNDLVEPSFVEPMLHRLGL
jgi:hypothetical protein